MGSLARIAAFTGITVRERQQLPYGLALQPDGETGGSLLFGPPETTAATVRNIVRALWLVSGAAAGKSYPGADHVILGGHEAGLLPPMLARVARVSERSFEDEDTDTALHCRLALAQADIVQHEADRLTSALIAFNGVSQLLLLQEGEAMRLPERAGHLAGVARADYAALMNYTAAVARFDAAIRRGDLPDTITRCRLLGRKVSRDLIDLEFSWYSEDARRVIAGRCSELFRRVLLCFLTHALIMEKDGEARLGLRRREIIALLDSAAATGEDAATIQGRLQAHACSLFTA